MFITKSQSGYNRYGEQFARGSFLCVFSHNEYKWEEQNNTLHFDLAGTLVNGIECHCGQYQAYEMPWVENSRPDSKGGSWTPAPYYYLKSCPAHAHEYKTMPESYKRVLYACVRHVSLRQLGHFMMGTARIAGQSVTLSGSYGSDGLPMDYESLSLAARGKVVRLPAELQEKFWQGGGHNSAGNEASAMREWANATFKSV